MLKIEIEIAKKSKETRGNRPASIPTCELKHAYEIVTHGSLLFGLKVSLTCKHYTILTQIIQPF